MTRKTRSMPRWIAAALAATMAMMACATTPVTVEFDREEDFSALRTFAWYPNRSPAQTEKRRRYPDHFAAADQAVDRRLMETGYQKVPRASADFLVSYHMSLEHRLDTRTVNEPYRMGGSEWEVHRVVTREVTTEYKRGTVVVDVLDPHSRRLVWRGSASGRFEVEQVPTTEQVEQRVNEILANFPPRPGS